MRAQICALRCVVPVQGTADRSPLVNHSSLSAGQRDPLPNHAFTGSSAAPAAPRARRQRRLCLERPADARRATLRGAAMISHAHEPNTGGSAQPSSYPPIQLVAAGSRTARWDHPWSLAPATVTGRSRSSAIAYSGATMSRRRMADHYDWNRVVMVRCHRCRRVIGRLAGGWFQPKRPLDTVTSPGLPVFTFPGSPDPLLHGRPMKEVTVIPLDRWTLAGLHCGCRKRDGAQMTWTLNLHRMDTASKLDKRTHDLIAGMPDYGLIGIHDDLEFFCDARRGSCRHH